MSAQAGRAIDDFGGLIDWAAFECLDRRSRGFPGRVR